MMRGKSVLVTGSTSGIGLGIARAFAAEGANVTLNGFGDPDAVEQLRRGIEEAFGVAAADSNADVTKPGEIADMISGAESTFGAAGAGAASSISRPRTGLSPAPGRRRMSRPSTGWSG